MNREASHSHIEQLFWQIENRPDAVAFELDGEEGVLAAITFGELYHSAQRYGAGLRRIHGVRPGDRVLCRMETSFEMIVALIGHALIGAVHVPVNTRYGTSELEHIVQDSDARVVVIGDAEGAKLFAHWMTSDTAEALEGVVILDSFQGVEFGGGRAVSTFARCLEEGSREAQLPRWQELVGQEERTSLMLYTSGTTGKSKGMMLSFRAVVAGIDALTTLWRFSEEDRLVLALPLFHVHGLGIGVHGALLKGCRTLLQPRFEPARVVQAMRSWQGTIFMGVPTMYTRLVRHLDAHPDDASALASARLYTSGSAALGASLFEAFERHTGHRILERYGMSETLLTISNPYEPHLRKPGTIGHPIASCEARIVREEGADDAEPGELQVRGQSLMSGYWRREAATEEAMTEDGWFCTGDAVRLDEDGYMVHVGRQSVDILKVGGYKISAREIEEVIARHVPEVLECAVFGVPDAEWGELIAVGIVLEEGAQDRIDDRVVLERIEGALADYKRPRQIFFIEEIPRNALGKVQKHRLRQELFRSS